jgi:mRNA-degrading endonuclease RelE of RelBE toxin-antitoxin system
MLSGSKLELYFIVEGDRSILLFISELPEQVQEEAEALIRLIQEKGVAILGGRLLTHENGLFELRGEHVRIFYKFSADNRLILLDGLLPDQGDEFLANIQRKAELV